MDQYGAVFVRLGIIEAYRITYKASHSFIKTKKVTMDLCLGLERENRTTKATQQRHRQRAAKLMTAH